jgi:hypothetical protein
MSERVYHAHALCTYGTQVERREQEVIRKCFPAYEIVDPGSYEDNIEKLVGGMNYCLKLVESCDILVFSRTLGQVTAGVGKEIKHALALGRAVFEVDGDALKPISSAPVYLSRERTRELYSQWNKEHQ